MLQRQTITMPLAQGLDTKTDDKQVVAGKLLELENGVFTTLKRITKRNGIRSLNTRITNQATINTSTSRPPTSNAELWFKMDEVAAPLVNSGTAGAGATLASVGTTTEGVPLDALSWATKSARVDTVGSAYSGAASVSYDPLGGQTKGTVSLWADIPVTFSNNYALVERLSVGSAPQFFIYVNDVSGTPKLQASWNFGTGGFGNLTGPDVTPYIGQPIFVALVRDAEDLWFYVNGVLVDATFVTADPTPYATDDGTNTGVPQPLQVGSQTAVYSDLRVSSGATSQAALLAAYRIATVPATTVQVQRIDAGVGIATYSNELLLADGQQLYSYDQGADGWTDKGAFVPVSVSASSVVKDAYQQTMPDGVTHSSGMQAYAWEDSSQANSIRYCIIDGATGQTVLPSTLLASNAIKPRVLVAKNNFLFYWYDTSVLALKLAVLPVTTPSSAPVVYTLTGSGASVNAVASGAPNYDANIIPTQAGDLIAVVFNNANAGGGTTLRMYDPNTPWLQAAGTTQATVAYRCRSVTVFPTDTTAGGNAGPTIVFATDNNSSPFTTTVRFYSFSFQLALLGSGVIASGLGYREARFITGCQSATSGVGFTVFYSYFNVVPQYISKAVIDSTYVVASNTSIWQRAVSPIGRAFKMNGTVYLPITYYQEKDYTSPTNGLVGLQSNYFLISAANELVAKAFTGTAGSAAQAYVTYAGNVPTVMISGVSFVDGGRVRLAVLEQVLVPGSTEETQTNVSSLDFNFGSASANFNYAELANNLHTSGGFVWMYDGVDMVEHNFHYYPVVSVPTASGSGHGLSAGTYTYTACYEWVDNQGNIHQSAPADFRTVTVTAGQQVQFTVNFLQLTAKTSARPVQIVVYRTKADKSIFYRISSLTSPQLNVINGGSATFTYTDTKADSDLILQLYTQPLEINAGIPAEVDNKPAPPTDLVVLHRNRLWVVDATDKLSLWYSKLIGPSTPVAFNDGFVKQIDPRGGNITALATIDDKLLVFKGDRIFFIVGQGPVNTDQNNDLSDAILITTDCGCIEPRSVVGTPVGIMFQSRKGIYLIDRSLAVQYIGASVERYNNEVITSAVLLAKTNQVRFTLESGKTLMYDYFVGQWGVFTNQHAVDSVIWNGENLILRANGKVLREVEGVFTDDGVPFSMKLATSWLSFANIQGFQRVRRMLVLGGQDAPGQLQISVCVDFDDTIVQQALVTPAQPQTFGSVTPYGGGLYGGTFQLYQWRLDLARQKTQAVKFVIEDLPSVTATALNLTSLAFEVGAKQGLNKVPASQTVS